MVKSLVSFSGGMDSATLLARVIKEGHQVEAVGFTYGSKHNQYENHAARLVAAHYGVPFEVIDLSTAMAGFKSDLLKSGGDVPEGHYEASSMSRTVVPGRNMIFVSILAGLALSRNAQRIYVGIHSGDHAIYPDCRPSFFYSMHDTIQAATENKVSLFAPYLQRNKTAILQEGLSLMVPYNLTRTCYKDQKVACGRCGSCQERLEAFRENGQEDPLEYETREALPRA